MVAWRARALEVASDGAIPDHQGPGYMPSSFAFQKPFEPESEPAPEQRHLEDRARQMQAEAMASCLRAGGRRIRSLMLDLAAPLRRYQQKRVLETQLGKCSKEEPERVGLERRPVHKPVTVREPAGHGPALWRRLDDILQRLAQSIALWARRRSLRHQLAGMPENILKDIGVNPSDLDGAVDQFLSATVDDNRPHAA